MASSAAPLLTGAKAAAVAELYNRFVQAPDAVDPDWRQFFGSLDPDARALLSGFGQAPDRGGNGHGAVATTMIGAACGASEPSGGNGISAAAVAAGVTGGRDITARDMRAATLDSIRALMLIRAYRVRGHLESDLDPLGIKPLESHPELDPKSYGFTDADMDRPIFINFVLGLETATLREIIQVVRHTYCGPIGVEFMHIQDPSRKPGFKNASNRFTIRRSSPPTASAPFWSA